MNLRSVLSSSRWMNCSRSRAGWIVLTLLLGATRPAVCSAQTPSTQTGSPTPQTPTVQTPTVQTPTVQTPTVQTGSARGSAEQSSEETPAPGESRAYGTIVGGIRTGHPSGEAMTLQSVRGRGIMCLYVPLDSARSLALSDFQLRVDDQRPVIQWGIADGSSASSASSNEPLRFELRRKSQVYPPGYVMLAFSVPTLPGEAFTLVVKDEELPLTLLAYRPWLENLLRFGDRPWQQWAQRQLTPPTETLADGNPAGQDAARPAPFELPEGEDATPAAPSRTPEGQAEEPASRRPAGVSEERTAENPAASDIPFSPAWAAIRSFRTWSSGDGQYRVEARCVEASETTVRLEDRNQRILDVPVAQLALADQSYARALRNGVHGEHFQPATQLDALRVWASPKGHYRLVARFVEANGGTILLRQSTGKVTPVAADELSAYDRQFLRERLARPR